MTKLFINKDETQYMVSVPSMLDGLYSTKLLPYMNKVMNYYHSSDIRASNSSVLVKLIKTMNINHNWTIDSVVRHTKNMISGTHRSLGLSDEYNITMINNGIIRNSREMFYIINEITTYNSGVITPENWKTYAPLKFRNHEFIDIYLNHPLNLDGQESDVVYSIDIIGLMLMYRQYAISMAKKDQPYSIDRFVAVYVLTNSIPSMCDLAVLNIYLGKGHVTSTDNHKIGTTEVRNIMNGLLKVKSEMKVLKNSKYFIITLLRNLKLPITKDAYELLLLGNIYLTTQSRLFVSLTLYGYLLSVMPYINKTRYSNSGPVNRLKRELRNIERQNIRTDEETKFSIMFMITELKGAL